MSANESPHALQNGHTPSHQREQHRLSQNIPQSLMHQVFPRSIRNVPPGDLKQRTSPRGVQQPFLTYHVSARTPNSLSKGILAKLPPYLQRGHVSAGASTVWLCRKARKEYEALPLDHPDRLYYTSPHHHVRVFDSSQLPPGAQVVHFSPAPTAYPAMHTQVVQLTPCTRTGFPPERRWTLTDPPTRPAMGRSSRGLLTTRAPYHDDDKSASCYDIV
ncbi:hypothetical protein C7M84_015203 [Penaeus vannamei]|uniref:Uncharacterized protein n=1 Tax=Penaeus vannamei TaxID=6689 RepID=A0A3R7QGL6_PENVA|nr:hypothetical protein C7M84_015203 [Penaeus vannamei]